MTVSKHLVNARRRRSQRLVAWLASTLLAACTTDLHTDPHLASTIAVQSGDRQVAAAMATLRDPLVVRVTDRGGSAVVGTTVKWATPDGGSFSPTESITDAGGYARTTWTLGALLGQQRANVSIDATTKTAFAAIVAGDDDSPTMAPLALTIETPDGLGQSVHPDYVKMPDSWPGAHEYLLMTPYPYGNIAQENPSIYEAAPSGGWVAPAGVQNPIVRPERGYLSDPDVVAVPESNELWVYYRAVGSRNEIHLIRSRNGVAFSAPRLVASAPNHEIVSPTVVRRSPTDWLMWSIDASVGGCAAIATSVELRRSTNGIDWSSPEHVTLDQGDGISPWHIDVQWIPSRNEYWAVYNGKLPNGCATAALFIATSPDGITWTTYPSPILVRGASQELQDIVYRSTFSFDETTDRIDFWYSGARFDGTQYVWRSAYQRRSRVEVFSKAGRRNEPASASIAPRLGAPPLINPP